jgi:hypothetical protein
VNAAAWSRASPFELPGNLPGCLSVRVPCRSFAAAFAAFEAAMEATGRYTPEQMCEANAVRRPGRGKKEGGGRPAFKT